MSGRTTVLALGNIADGMTFVGPFDDATEANRYADRHHSSEDWWVLHVQEPEGEISGLTPGGSCRA